MAAYVYRDGDDVPRDVTRVVVPPSVRVLPPNAFSWCEKLEEVRLHEGLEEIGVRAFHNCVSLRLRGCPSTVVRIGHEAFRGCTKLEEVQLSEGLETMGEMAFYDCVSLRRLDCPSTVVWIGARAFYHCLKLSVMELAGIVKVERNAFARSNSLERIGIPSRVLVYQPGTYRNYTCRLVTNGSIAHTRNAFLLIAPVCLATLPESNLIELGNSLGNIMNIGEGTDDDRHGRVCREVRKEVQGEVSAILGLAFWKAKINEAERASIDAADNHRENTVGGRERAEFDTVLTREAREGCRGAGKGKEIAQNVLPFLDGLW